MTKKQYITFGLYSIFLIVFNVLFYLLGGIEHSIAGWISYLFIHIAYFTLIFISRLVIHSKHSQNLKNPLNFLSTLHFIITFIIGILIICSNTESYKLSLSLHVITTGAYMALLLINIIYNENTLESERELENGLKYVKEGCQNIKDLIRLTEDLEIKKELEKLHDFIHSSPITSSNEAKKLESVILDKIIILKRQIKTTSKEEIINKVRQILKEAQERNQKV